MQQEAPYFCGTSERRVFSPRTVLGARFVLHNEAGSGWCIQQAPLTVQRLHCRHSNTRRFMVAVMCTAAVATGATCSLPSRCCAARASQHPRSLTSAVPAGSDQSFTVLAVGADGNCMFRALAQSRSFIQGADPFIFSRFPWPRTAPGYIYHLAPQ